MGKTYCWFMSKRRIDSPHIVSILPDDQQKKAYNGDALMDKSRGQKEAEVSEAMVKFEKEFMGRGPIETRTFIVDDLVVVRLRGVLTPAEMKVAESEDKSRGRDLIKQLRSELLEGARPLLEVVIQDILGVPVLSLHTDISTRTGERMIVFVLTQQPRFEV